MDVTCLSELWPPCFLEKRFAFSSHYLSKLVYLLNNSSKKCSDTLVYQTLHVMDRLLV